MRNAHILGQFAPYRDDVGNEPDNPLPLLDLAPRQYRRNTALDEDVQLAFLEYDENADAIPDFTSISAEAHHDARGTDSENDDEPVEVLLLQSTLRSSQFRQVKKEWLPFSGHWAIAIRGEVFELNRTVPWEIDELSYWIDVAAFRLFADSMNWMVQATYSSLGGAEARLDISTYDQYVQHRGEHTITRARLGTTTVTQDRIKSLIAEGNDYLIFYSIYCNNCQHFILDFCDTIDLDFDHAAVHGLWLESRIVFLLGCLAKFMIAAGFPLLIASIWHLKGKPRTSPLVWIAIAIFALIGWLWAFYILSPGFYLTEDLTHGLFGINRMYGICETSEKLRRALLSSCKPKLRFLYRFLLLSERIPYVLSSVLGLVVATILTYHQYKHMEYWYGDINEDERWLYLYMVYAQAFALVFYLFALSGAVFVQWIHSRGHFDWVGDRVRAYLGLHGYLEVESNSE